tara:strand:- start:18 stop:392 length:375 start_codon:yes stop_codon:yes gene_type:complete
MEYDNKNRGVLFKNTDSSYWGKINIEGVDFKLKTITIDDQTQELVISLGKLFVNDDLPDPNDKRPKMRSSINYNDKKMDFAGWLKHSKKGTEFISCQISEPYVKDEDRQQTTEESTPFDDEIPI